MQSNSRTGDGEDIRKAAAEQNDGKRRLSAGSRLALVLARRIKYGTFDVRTPEGIRMRCDGTHPGPIGPITIRHPRFARRMVAGGNVGLGESYMDGDFDSDRLADFLTVGAMNSDALDDLLRGNFLYRTLNRLTHGRNRNSRRGSKRNISYHYDLGNDFYEAWLDPSMTYSSAVFTSEEESLEDAQARKYDLILDRLGAIPGSRILEIGCGWGGFAEHAAKERGCRVTGVTISRAQYDYARMRIQRQGLEDRVDIKLQDYRDLEGTYDHIASIEMFEAVGEQYWPVFFENLKERLSDSGRAALQIITVADRHFSYYRSRPDFIQQYIFPGGMLPSPGALRNEVASAGLSLEKMEGYGDSYARTLAEWNRRFQNGWNRISAMGYDERFKRMWDYYLAYCEAGFRAGLIDVQHVELAKS